MSTLVRLSVVAVLVVLAFATTSGSPGSMTVSIDTPSVQAHPCTPGDVDYNIQTCAQINPAICAQYPQYCYNNQNQYQQYCVPGTAYYNLALCQQYGGQSNYYQLYCIPGTATYNQTLCASYGGQTQNTYYQQYCIVGTVTYNPTLCQQYGGQYNQYNQYCTPGATYNAGLCNQNQGSICMTQPAVCTPQYCQINPTICAGYNVQQTSVPSQVLVNAASDSVSCNGSMSLVIAVANASNQPVADGTAVTLTATAGQVSPPSATTSGGTVTALFSAGSASGAATITATAGGISGQKSITVNCSTTPPSTSLPSTTTPPPSSGPVYTSPPPPPSSGSNVFSPPNTGDGGLLALLRDE